MVRESVPSESLVPVHRVPREGLAASASAEAMMPRETMSATATVAVAGPTVTDPRLPSPAVTGLTACRPATCAALSGPTVSVMAMPAMMRVARKFKSLPVGKTLAAPASLRAPTFATEVCLAEATFVEATLAALAPGKLGPFAGTAGFGAAEFGPWSAFPCRSAGTSSVLRSCSGTTRPTPFPPVPFRSATSGTFPSSFTIQTALWTAVVVGHHAAFAPHFAAIITLAPRGPASGPLVGRVPPFGSRVALVEIAALAHPFLISIFSPAVFI